MNIQEAAILAQQTGEGMCRSSCGPRSATIIPTNTIHCCIAVSFEGKCNQRWQPLFEDLVADDWFVPSVFKETE